MIFTMGSLVATSRAYFCRATNQGFESTSRNIHPMMIPEHLFQELEPSGSHPNDECSNSKPSRTVPILAAAGVLHNQS